VLDPTELLRRLAALVPAPYTNLVRYHGVLAGRSRWRARLPQPPGKDADAEAEPRSQPEPESDNRPGAACAETPAASRTLPLDSCTRRRRSLPWAQLPMRVFFIDALTCPRCAASMVVLALISEPLVLRKILLHLGLPADVPPVAPAVHRSVEKPLFDEDAASAAPARPPP